MQINQPITPPAGLETHIRATLGDIARRLNAMPIPPLARSKVFESVLVEMANASGVPMHGWTAYNPAASAPPETASIAAALGTTATPHRNRYDISPFVKPALGASGTVIYTDAKTGEPSTLLVRTRKRPNEWNCPGGYMDLLPEAPVMYPERVDMKTRDTLEERTLDANAMAGQKVDAPPQAKGDLKGEAFASFASAQPVLDAHYKQLLKEKGWQEADRLMHDEVHVMGVLVANNIKLPQAHGFDFDSEGCYRRELKEEGGLDLAQHPQARTLPVKADLAYGISSGNAHSYTVNPHFMTDLGSFAAPPALAPHESDILEARWVPLRGIASDASGQYHVEGTPSLKLNAYAIPALERSLKTYLDETIKRVTHGQYESAEGVETAYGLPRPQGVSLVGGQGQDYLRASIQSAAALARAPLPVLSRVLSVAASAGQLPVGLSH